MADFTPPGRLSSRQHGEKTIQVQTEFAHRPRPRVTSSVVVDGQIVHKTDRPWEAELETEEGRKDLEKSLAEQHRQVQELVEARAAEFAGEERPLTDPGEYETPSFRDSMVEILGSLPSITALYEFDNAGKVIYAHEYRPASATRDREISVLNGFLNALPQLIRVGRFHHGCCYLQSENLILFAIRERGFGIRTGPSGSFEEIQRQFPELIEAIHD